MEDCRMKNLISILLLLPLVACSSTPSKSELDAEVKRLCAIDGGIKVYETVRLPAEKFDQFGEVRIPSRKDSKPTDEFYYEWDIQYLKEGKPEDGEADFSRSHFKLYRAADKMLVGESVAYSRRGGDLPGPWHPSHFTCPSDSGLSVLQKRVFIRNSRENFK
jgi:hypothetical protein